jgi:hypothetical protein
MIMIKKYTFPKKDLTNQVFNKLTVVRFDSYHEDSKGRRKPKWICKCECGITKSILQNTLVSGNQQSCGCLLEDFRKNILPKITSERNTIGEGLASFNNLYSNYRDRANKINVQFDISKEKFREITSKSCFYCNADPLQVFYRKTYNGNYLYNGIDRIDNTKGYISGNIVPCCEICNKAKRDMELDKFLKWIKRITEYASKISFNYKAGN